jgi:hypothetical protein
MLPVYFNHIPKCAGTTIVTSLSSAFPGGASLLGFRLAPTDSGHVYTARLSPSKRWLEAKFLAGHYGHYPCEHRLGDIFSIVVLREPVSRFKSIVQHNLRDRGAFAHLTPHIDPDQELVVNNQDLISAYRCLSMTAYLLGDSNVLYEGYNDNQLAGSQAVSNLKEYDIVMTDRNLHAVLDIVRNIFDMPHDETGLVLNSHTDFASLQPTVRFPSDTEGNVRQAFPEEFIVYEQAVAHEKRLLAAFSENPAKVLRHLKGRLADKRSRWVLDWSDAIPAWGWSNITTSGSPFFKEGLYRLLLDKVGGIEVLLEPGRRWKVFMTWWFGPHELGDALRLSASGKPISLKSSFPLYGDRHYVTYQGVFETPSRNASWTPLAFALDVENRPASSEAWLLDMSILPESY